MMLALQICCGIFFPAKRPPGSKGLNQPSRVFKETRYMPRRKSDDEGAQNALEAGNCLIPLLVTKRPAVLFFSFNENDSPTFFP